MAPKAAPPPQFFIQFNFNENAGILLRYITLEMGEGDPLSIECPLEWEDQDEAPSVDQVWECFAEFFPAIRRLPNDTNHLFTVELVDMMRWNISISFLGKGEASCKGKGKGFCPPRILLESGKGHRERVPGKGHGKGWHRKGQGQREGKGSNPY